MKRRRRAGTTAPPPPAGFARIAPALRHLTVPINALKPDPMNPRAHGQRNLAAIRDSLATYGQLKPVVAREGVIVAGEGTWRSAAALGWDTLAAVDAASLTLEQARAYGIVDNKSAELAEWDYQILGEVVRGLSEAQLAHTGFAPGELDPLLSLDWTPPAVDEAAPTSATHDLVPFQATAEQAAIIRDAIAKARARLKADDPKARPTVGQALVVVARAFLRQPVEASA